MNKKVYAIITAAGSGSRYTKSASSKKAERGKPKPGKPKQFLKLLGKPVILYSMTMFQKCRSIDGIIISSEKEYFDYLHMLAAKNNITKLSHLVEGGRTRFESVKNAFKSIPAAKGDFIFIHDAARPNINISIVEKMLNERCDVIPGNRVTETVKKEKNGYVVETLKRENLWNIQTPQLFKYETLHNSYKKHGKKKDFTDEASLVEYAGYRVKIIEGLRYNIKITTKDDLTLLKKIM